MVTEYAIIYILTDMQNLYFTALTGKKVILRLFTMRIFPKRPTSGLTISVSRKKNVLIIMHVVILILFSLITVRL